MKTIAFVAYSKKARDSKFTCYEKFSFMNVYMSDKFMKLNFYYCQYLLDSYILGNECCSDLQGLHLHLQCWS